MIRIWQCLFSPRLFMIYKNGSPGGMYQPNKMEAWGDKIITSVTTITKIGLYTSPFISLYIYTLNYTLEQMNAMATCFAGIGCLISLSFILRAFGRVNNPKYMEFLNILNSVDRKPNGMDLLRKYDFEFHAWPVSYQMPLQKTTYLQVCLSWIKNHPFKTTANADLPFYQRAFIQMLAFIATHTFGLRLIYPGCISIIEMLMNDHLFRGRIQLVEELNGKRAKIGTADGNMIDTMFVDNSESAKGKILVICCEGNAGFYEIGIMKTPIDTGYSALGWNHPGFACSTGLPYPSQEQNAIDAVMQYAINKLGFKPENIVLFGWSIGGYTAAWTACNYPIKALILDATFDDLLPLATNKMPYSWSLLVKEVVRSYVNLDIATLLKNYKGPIKMIRRTEDEIICLSKGDLSTNRANDLLLSIMSDRYPEMFEDINSKSDLREIISVLESRRLCFDKDGYLPNLEERIVLIFEYMRDFHTTHCTPLPEEHFQTIMDSIKETES